MMLIANQDARLACVCNAYSRNAKCLAEIGLRKKGKFYTYIYIVSSSLKYFGLNTRELCKKSLDSLTNAFKKFVFYNREVKVAANVQKLGD